MTKDPLEQYLSHPMEGAFRFINESRDGHVLMPVDDEAPRLLSPTEYVISVRNDHEGPRLEITFLRRYRAVSTLIETGRDEHGSTTNWPPRAGVGETRLRQEVVLEVSPSVAAQLAATLLDTLARQAPGVLEGAGIVVSSRKDTEPPAPNQQSGTSTG